MSIKLPDIEVIVGTYEEFLLGYQLTETEADQDGDKKVVLKQTFADKSHAGSLKCVAVQGQWIASGGSDDRIFVYDMRTRKQSQILLSHTGTINTLVFSPDLTHLLSGGADGHMIATRVGSWTTEGNWRKAHAGAPVTHISCHPSSKLALSLGGDQILHTWNLIKGRVAYKTNLKSKQGTLGSAPECLAWSTDGAHFSLSGPLCLEIWEIKTASVARREKMAAKPICVAWLNERECLVGLENGSIAWVNMDAEEQAAPKTIAAHEARVKAMSYLNDTLATVSSAGEIKVWRCDSQEQQLELIASTNIDCRPTCLGVLDLSQQLGNARPLKRSALASSQPLSQQQQRGGGSSAAGPAPPRGVVTIEYEKDEAEQQNSDGDSSEEEEKQQTAKVSKAKKAKPAAASDSEEEQSESSESDMSSADDASSDSDSQSRQPKRKQPKGRQPKAKQLKAQQPKGKKPPLAKRK